MPNNNLQQKLVDLSLFRQPDQHRTIWKNLSKQQMMQLSKLMSKMLLEHQKLQGGNCNE